MLAADEDAVICDLAQVYGVFDYHALPVRTAAALACGLPPESRIMRKLSGAKLDVTTTLLALAVDYLAILCWRQTEAGAYGRNAPPSIYDALTGRGTEPECRSYRTGADFEAERQKIIGKVAKNNAI